MPTQPLPFISRPPRDIAGWSACFEPSQLPVLASSAEALEQWRANEDDVDAHRIAETLGTDPLFTVKLLAHVAELRRGREGGDIETVTEALVMLGVPPFFRAFGPQPTVEDQLAASPPALAGFERTLRRAHRASSFAFAFAVHRMDHDAAVIHEAALLHGFAELLLWVRAPELALEIGRRQRADPALRSVTVQRELLGIELSDLQHALMQRWRLPPLLLQITDEHPRQETSQLRNVRLAVRVARHSTDGWDNPALPDDVADIAQLLQLGIEPTWRLLKDIDSD